MMQFLQFVAEKLTLELLFLSAASLFGLWVFVAMLRRGVDPTELVIGDDGKLSWTKCLGCVGGTVFTWGFIHMVAAGTLTEWFFNGFGLICFGTAFVYKMNALKSGIAPNQTTRVDAPAGASVNINVDGKAQP